MNIIVKFKQLLSDQSGATAIEYGMIAAAMGTMLVTVAPQLAQATSAKFELVTALFDQ